MQPSLCTVRFSMCSSWPWIAPCVFPCDSPYQIVVPVSSSWSRLHSVSPYRLLCSALLWPDGQWPWVKANRRSTWDAHGLLIHPLFGEGYYCGNKAHTPVTIHNRQKETEWCFDEIKAHTPVTIHNRQRVTLCWTGAVNNWMRGLEVKSVKEC